MLYLYRVCIIHDVLKWMTLLCFHRHVMLFTNREGISTANKVALAQCQYNTRHHTEHEWWHVRKYKTFQENLLWQKIRKFSLPISNMLISQRYIYIILKKIISIPKRLRILLIPVDKLKKKSDYFMYNTCTHIWYQEFVNCIRFFYTQWIVYIFLWKLD